MVFFKKSLLRFIRIVVLASFIFSGLPVKNYSFVHGSDNLRALAAKQDSADVINITRELYKATYAGFSCKDILKIIPEKISPEYVFFDIDDTLIDAESVAKLFVRAARNHGVTLSSEYVRKYIGVIKFGDPEEAMAIFSEFGTDKETVKFIIDDYNEIFEKALKTDYFKEFLYADTIEVFSYLKKRGIKIGIVTNRYEQLAFKQIESIGLLEYVAQNPAFKRTNGYAVLGGDSAQLFQKDGVIASGKAKGALLGLLIKIFDIKSAANCLLAGDTGADIEAARFNNMPSFLVVRNSPQKDGGNEINVNQNKIISLAKEVLRLDDGDDYFIKPTIIEEDSNIKEGDSVILFNFRGDRAEPMLRLFTADSTFKHFPITDLGPNIVPFAVYNDKYFKEHGLQGVVKESSVSETLGEVLAKHGKTQVRIAESEKFKHVTFFFDGLRDVTFPGVDTVQIASNDLDKHWKKPEMKAEDIAQEAVKWILGTDGKAKKDFVVINFANLDILGHFEKFDSIVEGALAVDKAMGLIREAVREAGGVLITTADHGSGEQKVKLTEKGIPILDKEGNPIPHKAHAFDNKVPFIIEGAGGLKLKQGGSLKNISPTILELMGIAKPGQMTADSLLEQPVDKAVTGPVVLVVRDGWGISKFNNPEALKYNAVFQAHLRAQELGIKFNDDEMLANDPHTELWAHGEYVGHPAYQMGDSENGHSNIGAGRDVASTLFTLDKMLETGEFTNNKIVHQAIDNAKKGGHKLHLVGMVSEGGVHSHIQHLFKLLQVISKEKEGMNDVVLQPIFDGRDIETSETPGWEYLLQVFQEVDKLGLGDIFKIGVISGRYYAMDRDAFNQDKKGLAGSHKLWLERVKPWYDAIVHGQGRRLILNNSEELKEKKEGVLREVENIIAGSNGKIKAALFDIGGVLLNYPRSNVINKFQKVIKVKSGKEITEDEVEKLIFTGESAQKLRVGLPIEDFVDELNRYLREKLNSQAGFELKEFMDILFLDYEPPLNMVNLVRDLLDRRMPLYVLSNSFTSNKFNLKELIKDKLNSYYSKPGEKEIFNDDNLVMSNEIGVAKPNSMAFNQALEKIRIQFKANLNSDNILFFDDQWENASIAKQLGFYTFGFNEEVSGVIKFLDAQARAFKVTGGKTVFLDYLKKVNDEILKLRGSITDNNLALVVHASFLKKGGALDALREVLQLKPYVKLGIYGKGSDKLAALFNGDKGIITTATLDEMITALNNHGGVAGSKDIVVLSPSETLDRNWETLKQVGFSEKGIGTVDVAKAMEALVGTPGAKEAFKKFYGELKDQKIISSASYDATKDKIFTELKKGTFDLPQIELVEKISEAIAKESDSVSKFVDKYI